MGDMVRTTLRLGIAFVPMAGLGFLAFVRGEWVAAGSAALTACAVAVFFVWWSRQIRSEAGRFIADDGGVRVVLTYDSVPAPWNGRKVLPLMTRQSPGLPMQLSIEDGSLRLVKKQDAVHGSRRFEMSVPLGIVHRVEQGTSRAVVGGRSLTLDLNDGSRLVMDVPTVDRQLAGRIVERITEARSIAPEVLGGAVSVEADT